MIIEVIQSRWIKKDLLRTQNKYKNKAMSMRRQFSIKNYGLVGGGQQVVSVLVFYSIDPSSNPADVYMFSVTFVFETNE